MSGNVTFSHDPIEDSDAEAIVNIVNCMGIFTSQESKSIRSKFSDTDYYDFYLEQCRSKELRVGTISLYYARGTYIINMPISGILKGDVDVDYVIIGLDELGKKLEELSISSVSISKGGFEASDDDWSMILGLIEMRAKSLPSVKWVVHI